MRRLLGAATVAASLFAGASLAETCGGTYTVKGGDSLSAIADSLYKNARLWTSIHTINMKAVGENPDSIRVGQKLSITCISGLPVGLSGGEKLASTAKPKAVEPEAVVTRAATGLLSSPIALPRIKLVTGDDFAPFTQRGLMADGLLAEVVEAAMTDAVGQDGYKTFWINDWSSHLSALMPEHVMEMAFPWAQPDCDSTPNEGRCANYHFSEPMFEYLVLLFVNKSSPIPFQVDGDLEGRTLCRPEGYLTHMLDQNGRNWVAENKVTLVQPRSVNDCFKMLSAGEVEAVVMNEFTARDAIKALDLSDQIEAVQSRPVSITGLHVLVHKDHPQADVLLTAINSGLAGIKTNGQYGEIVNRHMSQIWANF